MRTKATTKVKVPTFKGTSFKVELEKKYRERSLNNHLRSVPLFASVDEEFIWRLLKQNVELVSYNQEPGHLQGRRRRRTRFT